MRQTFNPDFLILGRELRGFTTMELAGAARLDLAALCQYEGGQLIPSDEDLTSLSAALEFPIGFFFRQGKRRGPESWTMVHINYGG